LSDLQPHYDKEFRCIGPECEDLCCRTWNVFVDRATFDKYQAVPALKPLADAHLVQISHAQTDSRYAQIQFPAPSHTCPFLAPDQWCSIHRDYGPGYLAPICHTYPRVQREFDGMTEKPLYLSCPEAARLILFQPNFVPIERNTKDDRPRLQQFLRMAEQPAKDNSNQRKNLSHARTFSLLLIQDRSYPLWQRLFMLGLFSKRLAEVFAARQFNLLPQVFTEYAQIVRDNRLRSLMETIPVQATAQLNAVIQVLHRLQSEHAGLSRVQECIQDFMRGIQYDPSASMETMASSYSEAYERYYAPFVEKHPFVMENYLSNYIFRTQFPEGPVPPGERNDPTATFYRMALQYAMIKGALIGMAGHYREAFGAEQVVKLVQSFSKSAEHSAQFLRGLNSELAGSAGLALLLKN
jgi:lysine-N-methylase